MEFVTAQIRNPHTRAAYGTAVTRFFGWCEAHGLALAQISPIAVATYIDEMHGRYRAPTIKQHLAAIRRLFDWLVTGQVMPTNPATSGARADPRREDRQDAGAAAHRSAAAAGHHRHRNPPRPARSRPAGRDGLRRITGRRHAVLHQHRIRAAGTRVRRREPRAYHLSICTWRKGCYRRWSVRRV